MISFKFSWLIKKKQAEAEEVGPAAWVNNNNLIFFFFFFTSQPFVIVNWYSSSMSVTELKERHIAATETVNNLRERLKQRRISLLDTDSEFISSI